MGFAYICSTFCLSLNKFKGLIRTFPDTHNLKLSNLKPNNLRNLWFSKSEPCVESTRLSSIKALPGKQTYGINCGVTLMYKPTCLLATLSRPARNASLHSDSVINFINRIRKTSLPQSSPQSDLSSFHSWLFTYP